MKTMQLLGGDLVIAPSGDYAMITDASKVKQDVRNALIEPVGNDRFHPGWGSTLNDYIGLVASAFQQATVLGEINRVVGNYAAVQRDRVTADVLSGNTARFTTDEIISSVTGVNLIATQDRFAVTISIGTVSGSTVDIQETLS